MSKANDEKFEKAQAELNAKIRAIMGPTPLGDTPTEDIPKSQITSSKNKSQLKTAPELPVQPQIVKPTAPKPEPAAHDELNKPSSSTTSVEPPKTDNPSQLTAEHHPEAKKKFSDKLKAWLKKPIVKKSLLVLLILAVITLLAVPVTRYFLLNSVGVRSHASISITDNSTQQPLKNVRVSLGDQSGLTDDNGNITLTKVKLGSSDLKIDKRAFASVTRKITVGWGNNPLGSVALTPVGVQYSFLLNDFLSNKPIVKAQASSGEADAVSDNQGRLVITIDKTDIQSDITIHADGYRDEKRMLDINSKAFESIKMVPAHEHSFVSKRSGKFDVYKVYIDGSNEELALAGTGAERDDMVLVPHPTENTVAVVSTRDNIRNQDGYLLSTLNLLDLNDNHVVTIAQSERIQVFGWANGKLVYVQVAAGASGTNPKRNRLNSYDPKTQTNTELASANYFNDVVLIGNEVYYAPSSAFQNGSDTSLFRIDVDTNNKQAVFNKETWNIFRVDYDHLNLAVQQDWYSYDLTTQKSPEHIVPPANPKTRVYVSSPDNSRSVWIDQRDGKGVLLLYDTKTKKETTVKSQSGLKYPVYWVSNSTMVYRINTEQETADYALNLDGGNPQKIRDVTNTAGIDKWYYYQGQ